MQFDYYQKQAYEYAVYPDKMYPYFALAEETGELLGKMAKMLRGDTGITETDIHKELGDVLWQLSAICSDRGVALSYIADVNLRKLSDRRARDKIRGSGDAR